MIRSASKVVYRRYASLYFVCGVTADENELIALEIVHRYVESLDAHFGNARLTFVLPHLQFTDFHFISQVTELDM